MIFAAVLFCVLFCRCADRKENRETPPEEIPEEINPPEEIQYPTGELILVEGACFPDVADKYTYRIQLRSEEWYQLIHTTLLSVECQLPEDVLKSISTLGLIRSFIDVPYSIRDSYLISSSRALQTSLRIFSRFNSVQELLTRKDAAESLIVFYTASDRDCIASDERLVQDELFSSRHLALTYLFTTPEIVDNMTHDNKVEIVEFLLEQYKRKRGGEHDLLCAMVAILTDDLIAYFGEEALDYKNIPIWGAILDSLVEAFDLLGIIEVDDLIAFAENFIK